MGEVLCVDGTFPSDFLKFYKEHGVSTPEKDKIYNIREVRRDTSKYGTTDNIGFLLEEIKNPKVPVTTPLLGERMVEPSWNSSRFRHLNGDEITSDSLREEMKQQKGIKLPSQTQTLN